MRLADVHHGCSGSARRGSGRECTTRPTRHEQTDTRGGDPPPQQTGSLTRGWLAAACKGGHTPRSEPRGGGRATHLSVSCAANEPPPRAASLNDAAPRLPHPSGSRAATRVAYAVRGAEAAGQRPVSAGLTRHKRLTSTPVLRVLHAEDPTHPGTPSGRVALWFSHAPRHARGSYDTSQVVPCCPLLVRVQLSSTAARPALPPAPAGRGPAWPGRCRHRCPPATRSTATPLAAPHPSTPRHRTPGWRTSVTGGGKHDGQSVSHGQAVSKGGWGKRTRSRATHRTASGPGCASPATATQPRAAYPGGGCGAHSVTRSWAPDPVSRQTST